MSKKQHADPKIRSGRGRKDSLPIPSPVLNRGDQQTQIDAAPPSPPCGKARKRDPLQIAKRFFIKKNTHAAPRVVPRNGIRIPRGFPNFLTAFRCIRFGRFSGEPTRACLSRIKGYGPRTCFYRPIYTEKNRLIGRCEEPRLFINVPDKPVRPLLLAPSHRSSRRKSGRASAPEHLPISGLFVRERVKAVQRQNNVKCTVRIRSAHLHPPCRKVTFFRCRRSAFSCACPIISAE